MSVMMYSENAQTFRCLKRHFKVVWADLSNHDFIAEKEPLRSSLQASYPVGSRILGENAGVKRNRFLLMLQW
jgi:hypothetical protein